MPVLVDVFAKTLADGTVGFTHEWGWLDGGLETGGRIEIPEKKKGESGTPIHFHLHDLTRPRRGLQFKSIELEPIWVTEGHCPGEKEPCSHAEVPVRKIKRSRKVLRIFDNNNDPCTLGYRLRFEDENGRTESYDPVIINGGTTRI